MNMKPEVVKTTRTYNTLDRDQTKTITLETTKTVTESWSNEKGVSVGITIGTSIEVPFISETNVEINTEYRETWTTGK